jgi:(1->4)-alpha-D-glucan 1-alpha-D-glucosylmutase
VSDPSPLARQCDAFGIQASYRDALGAAKSVPETTLRALIDCLKTEQRDRLLPPVSVHRQAEAIRIPVDARAGTLRWTVGALSGDVEGGQVTLPGDLAVGHHELRLYIGEQIAATSTLIVTPHRAFLPAVLYDGGRLWGLATQLFGLRSSRNWGIGDFTDLATLIDQAAPFGVAAIGLTPLHALFPDEPDRCSPYSPSSRNFLNVLYIDPEAIPEFKTCAAARELRARSDFAEELARHRDAPLVDYAGVARCKAAMFALLYRQFRDNHLARRDAVAEDFERFRTSIANLRLFATFDALRAHFAATGEAGLSWHTWPPGFRDPYGPQVAAFAARHDEEITYFEYLQWHAHRQLTQCQERARAAGMPIGVYLDIAVGVDSESAEAWWSQDYLVSGWSIGAPPDNWNLKGQSWGAPPPNPTRMRELAYEPVRAFLEANMRSAGAVRIDHVLGLMRLFWVPADADASAGAYVKYPLQDLLGIVALESERQRCLVIGEDLGTVPDGMRDALLDAGILCYRLLYFEQVADSHFRRPEDWIAQALAAPSTHDLATLPAFWQGADLDLRRQLNLYPSQDVAIAERHRRDADRQGLIAALVAEELPTAADGSLPVEAIYRFLARTRSCLMMLQPEDLLDVTDPQNVPGTTREYPNWRRKLPIDVADLFSDPRLASVAAAINSEGRAAR